MCKEVIHSMRRFLIFLLRIFLILASLFIFSLLTVSIPTALGFTLGGLPTAALFLAWFSFASAVVKGKIGPKLPPKKAHKPAPSQASLQAPTSSILYQSKQQPPPEAAPLQPETKTPRCVIKTRDGHTIRISADELDSWFQTHKEQAPPPAKPQLKASPPPNSEFPPAKAQSSAKPKIPLRGRLAICLLAAALVFSSAALSLGWHRSYTQLQQLQATLSTDGQNASPDSTPTASSTSQLAFVVDGSMRYHSSPDCLLIRYTPNVTSHNVGYCILLGYTKCPLCWD